MAENMYERRTVSILSVPASYLADLLPEDCIEHPRNDDRNPRSPIPVPEDASASPCQPGALASPTWVIGALACNHSVLLANVTDELLLLVLEGFLEDLVRLGSIFEIEVVNKLLLFFFIYLGCSLMLC